MLRYARLPKTRSYRVEVSGWDSRDHFFFVENCDLFWSDDSGKHVRLNRRLNNNAIVFVRLLDPAEGERAHPVVYQASWLGKAENGMHQFCLRALQPRVWEAEGSRV
jgi:hypothetical protein